MRGQRRGLFERLGFDFFAHGQAPLALASPRSRGRDGAGQDC
jgi:hypothetical protein